MRSVLIVSNHFPNKHSGGRYHSWLLGEAAAALGLRVTVWCDARPTFLEDFAAFPAHGSIILLVDAGFQRPPTEHFDDVWLVPQLGLNWLIYAAAIGAAKRSQARLFFLDFEAPNWFNSVAAKRRGFLRTLPWRMCGYLADYIVSSSLVGSQWARSYYAGSHNKFLVLPICVNSLVADQAPTSARHNDITMIFNGRKDAGHKGGTHARQVISNLPVGWSMSIIGEVPDSAANLLRATAAARGAVVTFLGRASELAKFTQLKKTKAFVFLSTFEGFGLPPLEAAYCGASVLSMRYPVAEEILNGAAHITDSIEALCLAVSNLEAAKMPGQETAAAKYDFPSFLIRYAALMESTDVNSGASERASEAEKGVFYAIFEATFGVAALCAGLAVKIRRLMTVRATG